MFTITYGKGFHIKFLNGVTLSTQIGAANYCSNYDNSISEECKTPAGKLFVQSPDCEIAIWDKDKKWITKQAIIDIEGSANDWDDVKGRIEVDEWLKYFDWARNYKGKV